MARLTVLMGAPGSGKSTYASNFTNVVSNDRRGGEAKPGEILHDAYRQINNLLAAGKDVVFDTTGANPAVRKAALSIAAKHGAQTSAVVLDTSLATCLDAQTGRARPVSGAEVCRIHADVQKQIPGLAGEGFGSVRVTRDRR